MKMDYAAEEAAVKEAYPNAVAVRKRGGAHFEVRDGGKGEVLGVGFLVGSAWKDADAKLKAQA